MTIHMESSDITEILQKYIIINQNDSSGIWEYAHRPYLTEILKNLNQIESEEFSLKIWDWPQSQLYDIADPIIFSNNNYFDADFLYIKIFSITTDIEELEYLVENIILHIDLNQDLQIKNWTPELILNLKKNILKIIDLKDDYYRDRLNMVMKFLNQELKSRE